MANSKVHAILGELHRLLSLYSAEDFIEAGRYSGTPRKLSEVLLALSREVDSARAGGQAKRGPFETRERVRISPRGREDGTVLYLLHQSPYFESIHSMATFAKNIGLRLQTNSKESRERVARRLASLIEKLPQPAKDRIIADLRAGEGNQTQGWVDVIKSANQ